MRYMCQTAGKAACCLLRRVRSSSSSSFCIFYMRLLSQSCSSSLGVTRKPQWRSLAAWFDHEFHLCPSKCACCCLSAGVLSVTLKTFGKVSFCIPNASICSFISITIKDLSENRPVCGFFSYKPQSYRKHSHSLTSRLSVSQVTAGC